MAPKRVVGKFVKRSLEDDAKEPTQEVKKAKNADSTDERLDAVESGFVNTSVVSETSREMLRRMVRGSLGAPTCEPWHPYQEAVVDMLREVLNEVEADLAKQANAVVADVSEVEQAACASTQAAAEAEHSACTEAWESAKAQFCEDNLDMQAAWHSFSKAANAKAFGDTESTRAAKLSQALEAAMRDNYPPLLKGTCKGNWKADSATHLAVLAPLICQVPLDDSLARAFPVAASKRAEDRGAFDQAALSQLQAEFVKHVVTLAAQAKKLISGTDDLKAREVSAEAVLDEARARQRRSASSLREAELEYLDAGARVGTAAEREREIANAILGEKAQRVARRRNLEEFQSGPMVALHALCTRRTASPQTSSAPMATIAPLHP